MSLINLFHVAIVAPLLLWAGYYSTRVEIPLMIFGLGAIAYHGWKTVNKQLEGKCITEDYKYQINVLHFLFVGPLVAWTGYKMYNGKTPTDLEKTTLLLLGCIALVYHSMKLMNKKDE